MSKANPDKYPIHISKSGTQTVYLCGDKLQYTPTPVKLADDSEWHEKRPLCKKCNEIHFSLTGEVLEWPPK